MTAKSDGAHRGVPCAPTDPTSAAYPPVDCRNLCVDSSTIQRYLLDIIIIINDVGNTYSYTQPGYTCKRTGLTGH